MRQRHEQAVAEQHRQRRAGGDDLGIGADHEQHGLGVERVGEEAVAQRAAVAVRRRRLVDGAAAEGAPADIHQIAGTEHAQQLQQQRRLLQQAGAEQGVHHVHLHAQADAERGGEPGAFAVQQAVAADHGEVGAGADHGEQGNGHHGKQFSHCVYFR
ncbi:hypothetical protein D3C85_1431790 [compost metagenome]